MVGRGERMQRWADSIADRLGVTIWGVVAGSVAIVAAAFGGWWALKSPDVPPVESVLPRVSDVASALDLPQVGTSEAFTGRLVVHVEGAVGVPGVHELAQGSRVHDAIDAADGLTSEADRSRLNLAAPLVDGQRVWVPSIGEAEPTVVGLAGPTDGAAAGAARAPVNVNTGNASALQSLPGIGPSIAAAIIRHREEHGVFVRVDDLLEVPGIGEAKLAQIAPLVRV